MTPSLSDQNLAPEDGKAALRKPPRRRWWLLAVDGLLLAVLAAAVGWMLLLSSHGLSASFEVRLTIAVLVLVLVGQAMLRRLLRPGQRFQFSLRTLLLFVLVCCYGLGLLTPIFMHRSAVRQLRNLGAFVKCEKPTTPIWLRSFVGKELFAEVEDVSLSGGVANDEGIARAAHLLRRLNGRLRLHLFNPSMSDDGLKLLCEVPNLQFLRLHNSRVTDAGLRHLGRLPSLEVLDLGAGRVGDGAQGTLFTDIGLANLADATKLRALRLYRTRITGARLAELSGLTELRVLRISDAPLEDAHLEGLVHLRNLECLQLLNTPTSDTGLVHIGRLTHLKNLWLNETQVTDAGLEDLVRLSELRALSLTGTKVTDQGVQRLRKILPETEILYRQEDFDRVYQFYRFRGFDPFRQ